MAHRQTIQREAHYRPQGRMRKEGACDRSRGGLPVVGIHQEVDAAVAAHKLLLHVAPRDQRVAAAAGCRYRARGSW